MKKSLVFSAVLFGLSMAPAMAAEKETALDALSGTDMCYEIRLGLDDVLSRLRLETDAYNLFMQNNSGKGPVVYDESVLEDLLNRVEEYQRMARLYGCDFFDVYRNWGFLHLAPKEID